MTTKRTLTRWAGLFAASAIVFAACTSDGGSSAAPSDGASPDASSDANRIPIVASSRCSRAPERIRAIISRTSWGSLIASYTVHPPAAAMTESVHSSSSGLKPSGRW